MSRESCWPQLDGVSGCRTSGVSMAQSVKLGTARSRIRIGEESNGFPGPGPARTHFCENNPMHSRYALEITDTFLSQKFARHSGARLLARARNPLGGGDGGRMDSGFAPAARPGMTAGGKTPYCVFATLGGWAVVTKLVASSMAGPSGVGTFSQNGTRMRVPAIGAKAISMLRWAARYLITGRSGM
jgi:hypothetical protein